MILLAAAVLANLIIAICFKLFDRLRVDHFTAIIINYWASAILGSVISGQIPVISYTPASVSWTYFGLVLGVCFVGGFTVTALSVRYTGMAVTTAMQRMSLLISAGYAVLVFHEPFGILKISGMLLAVLAILMITRRENRSVSGIQHLQFLLLPIGTLVLSGIIESVLYYVHAKKLAIHGDVVFSTYAFSIAACIGGIIVVARVMNGAHKITWRDVAGGVVLGVPNFFTIYLILALLQHGFSGSVLYPVLNILVLAFTAVTGLYLFREKLKKVNVIGIVFALLAILLISLSD